MKLLWNCKKKGLNREQKTAWTEINHKSKFCSTKALEQIGWIEKQCISSCNIVFLIYLSIYKIQKEARHLPEILTLKLGTYKRKY